MRKFLCSSGNVSNPCGDLTGALCKRIFRRGSARCGSERLFVSEQSDTPVRFSDRTGVSFMQLEETQYSSSLKKFIRIYYIITNEICANKPHRLRRSEAMGGKTEHTNCVDKLIARSDKIVIMLITIK